MIIHSGNTTSPLPCYRDPHIPRSGAVVNGLADKIIHGFSCPAEQESLNADGAAIWWTVQVAQRWSSTSLLAAHTIISHRRWCLKDNATT
jgi:hypothetical protein